MVDDAVEKNPFKRPSVVDVELYPVCEVNGKAPVIVRLEPITNEPAPQEAVPAQVMVPVAVAFNAPVPPAV